MDKQAQRNILVVDDDPGNRKLLKTLLRAEGFTVRCAESGAAALAAVASELPDLILLDLMMPGMDGFEVVRHLKAGVATRDIPIVMVTALEDDASRGRLAAAGVEQVIAKPIDHWEVKACLERLLPSGKERK